MQQESVQLGVKGGGSGGGVFKKKSTSQFPDVIKYKIVYIAILQFF